MQAPVFEEIMRDLGERSSRRGVLRLLGGIAAMSAVALTTSGEADARAKRKSRGQGAVSAQGKKGARITICHQTQTLTVKKKGYQSKYPGATVGPCGGNQQAVCTSWVLSGGPDRTTPIVADDDLQVMVNGSVVFNDGDGKATSVPPVSFTAQVGGSLGVVARDAVPSCRSLSPLWLHCATTGQKRQLFAGNNDGCAPGRTAGTFVSEVFTISV
jgi:hypothetical protein